MVLQIDESGEISIDKLTAYKTDLEYLDDHFQVHFHCPPPPLLLSLTMHNISI